MLLRIILRTFFLTSSNFRLKMDSFLCSHHLPTLKITYISFFNKNFTRICKFASENSLREEFVLSTSIDKINREMKFYTINVHWTLQKMSTKIPPCKIDLLFSRMIVFGFQNFFRKCHNLLLYVYV